MPASLVDKRCCLIISRIQVEHNKRERERARGPRFKVSRGLIFDGGLQPRVLRICRIVQRTQHLSFAFLASEKSSYRENIFRTQARSLNESLS